ncbi:MAG: phosphodiester glycosidase family protein [Pseudomonadota bacterium]
MCSLWITLVRAIPIAIGTFLSLSASSAAANPTVFTFSPRTYDLQLHWKNGEDQFWTLDAVREHLESQDRCVAFLSNAGIYGEDYAPLGLHIENGEQVRGVNPAKGSGNFSWNSGVFALRDGRPEVRRHTAWPGNRGVNVANQSGPALVIGGKRTSAGRSDAGRYSRGAIVSYRDGRAGFVHTSSRIEFRRMVDLAQAKGRVQGMLYLDGRINDWWQRGMRRPARGFPWLAGIWSVSRRGPCPDPIASPRPVPKPEQG